MNINKIVAIGIRLFAITLFLETLQQTWLISDLFQNGSINSLDASLIFISLTVITPSILGLILWFFPLLLSNKIVKPEINTELKAIDVISFLTCIIIGIGLFTISYAIPDVIYNSIKLHLEYSNPSPLSPENTETKNYLFISILECFFGILFIFKSKSLSIKLQKIST